MYVSILSFKLKKCFPIHVKTFLKEYTVRKKEDTYKKSCEAFCVYITIRNVHINHHFCYIFQNVSESSNWDFKYHGPFSQNYLVIRSISCFAKLSYLIITVRLFEILRHRNTCLRLNLTWRRHILI